ncbi:MAG: LysE family transporter [Bacteroidales bacterium]|nr:LysE family transporter [Bacteroidales bacterium]MBP5764394.1 LysE family transporter [Bacteroidales bacterium]
MPIELLPSLLFTMLVVGYTPGPANLYALACCLKFGRRKALVMWRGLLVGFIIAISIMVVLTHILGELLGQYVVYLKYIGAAYILWLAWKTLRTSLEPKTEVQTCTFTSGLLLQLTNAKMLLFELTVFSVYVIPYTTDLPESQQLLHLFLMAALLLLPGPGFNLVWLYTGAYMRRFLSRYEKQVDITMAVLLALCAGYLMVI